MLKNQKGITLVSLVVTIIVLIILAAVSISLVLGENGIINRAKNGANDYQNAAAHESNQINAVDSYLNSLGY